MPLSDWEGGFHARIYKSGDLPAVDTGKNPVHSVEYTILKLLHGSRGHE